MIDRLDGKAVKSDALDPLALSKKMPELSASVPITRLQKTVCMVLGVLALMLLAWKPWVVGRIFVLVTTLFYLLFTVYKLVLVRLSIVGDSGVNVTVEEVAALRNTKLPVYTILVPMYREPESIRHVVQAIDRLDYPGDRKDVHLLLEADDMETRAAAEKLKLPKGFQITLVPPSEPRTKPKACNIGLAKAQGEFLVIYDAEDRPEVDQLLKAVAAFRREPLDVVCLQSRLNFYNPRQNLLTRWFTAEYSSWFDLSLPGLCAVQAVIPLGGTSNHFRTEALRMLMGWDAYNVTEDCDLGVRIYRLGWRTRMLHTTTWEEACGSLPYWIRQRTRWLKGYMQTYLVHMRRPDRLVRELGIANFLHFQVLIGGIIVSFLINPLFWAMALLWFAVRAELLVSLFPGGVFAMGALCLFAGNFVFAYTGAIGCYRRGYFDLVKYAIMAPLYWVMMSYSGWRALFQFFVNPFQWEKTKHGLFQSTGP